MYGGTQEEMKRLLVDAEKISGIKYDISSYADIVDAIHVVQTEMGITGTTAKEAATTIQGSAGMMKAAWENLVTGFANPEADINTLLNNFTDSVVTFGENLIPTIQNILPNVTSGIVSLANSLLPQIPPILQTLLPSVIQGAESLIEGFIAILPSLIETLTQIVSQQGVPLILALVDGILSMLPVIIESAVDIILALAMGLVAAIPELLPSIVQVITDIATMMTEPDMLSQILATALSLILVLGRGLAESAPQLVGAISDVIIGITDFLVDPKNIGMIWSTAWELIIELGAGLVSAIPELLKHVGEIWLAIVDNFRETDWSQIGKDLVAGFRRGIESAWGNLKEWFTGLFGDLKSIAKKILGIESPSKEFRIIGKFVDEGLAEGLEKNADLAYSATENLASGIMTNFDADLNAESYIGETTGTSSDEAVLLLGELVDMFTLGRAKTNISNSRDFRRITYG